MAGRYTGPSFKQLRGPEGATRRLQARARVIAGRLLNRMRLGGIRVLSDTERLADGSVILVKAIQQPGWAPLVSLQVFAPSFGVTEKAPTPVYRIAMPLVWLPEGFVITPRETQGATQGWGMPRVVCDWDAEGEERFTPVDTIGRGTPYSDTPWQYPRGSGAIKQVMLNRFADNKLPRATLLAIIKELKSEDGISSTQAEILENASRAVTHWPLFFAPDDPLYLTAVFEGEERFVTWQFEQYVAPSEDPDDPENPCRRITPFSKDGLNRAADCANHLRFSPFAEEVESGTWHCHWPVEKPYADEAKLEIFRLVNELRSSLDLEPLFFPLETHGTAIADITTWQTKKHNNQAHNSVLFDPGYSSTVARCNSNSHYLFMGENLALITPGEVSDGDDSYAERLAAAAVNKWISSPPHFALMVSDRLTVTEYDREVEEEQGRHTGTAGCLEVGQASGVTITKLNTTDTWADQELDSPITGTYLTQNFVSNQTWVGFGDVYWEGQSERISWPSKRPFRYALIRTNIQKIGYDHGAQEDITDMPEVEYLLGHVFFYRGRQVLFSKRYRVLGAALVKTNPAYNPENEEGDSSPTLRSLFKACLYDLESRVILHVRIPSNVPYLQETEAVPGEGPTVQFEVIGSYPLEDDDYAISHALFSQDGSKCVVPIVSAGSDCNEYYLTNLGTTNTRPTASECVAATSLSASVEPIERDNLVVVERDPPLVDLVEVEGFENRLGNYTACYGSFSPRHAYVERFKRDNGIPCNEDWIDDRFFGVHNYYGVSPDEEPQYITDKTTWSKIRHVEFAPTPSVVSSYEPRATLVDKTSSITYTYAGGGPSHSDCRRDFGWEYNGSGNVYADYVADNLVFAQVEIDMWWTSVVGSPHFKKTLRLGGDSWVLTDMLLDAREKTEQDLRAIVGDNGFEFYNIGISNFAEGRMKLYELLHFDIRHPEDICYTGLDGGGWLMWDHKLNRKMKRQLFVRNELVWESEPFIRTPTNETSFNTFTDGLSYVFGDGEFASLEFPKVYSGVKSPLYYRFLGLSPHHAAAFASSCEWDKRKTTDVPFYEPELVYDRWKGRNLLEGSTAFAGGFASRLWPRDAAGLTAMDEVVYEPIRDVTSRGTIGSFPSFMPWVQKDSTVIRDNSGVVHCTQAWFLRYNDEYIFQLYQPYWLKVLGDDGTEQRVSWALHGKGRPPVVGEHATHDRYLTAIDHLEPRDAFYINWPDTRESDDPEVEETGSPVGEAYSDWHDKMFDGVGWEGPDGYNVNPDNAPTDGCWLVFSSLDLSAVTGVSGLSNNLYPLGVV